MVSPQPTPPTPEQGGRLSNPLLLQAYHSLIYLFIYFCINIHWMALRTLRLNDMDHPLDS